MVFLFGLYLINANVLHTHTYWSTVSKPATGSVEEVHEGRVFGCEPRGACSTAQYVFLNETTEKGKGKEGLNVEDFQNIFYMEFQGAVKQVNI